MSSLKIEVNQNRLIQNIGSVFSDNTKVISELLQNSRRAGATRIDVVRGEGFISVSDNGSGIKSFQDLLTLAQSNWDESVMDEDAPYGMGFFSALFAAERVVVQSQGKEIEVLTTGNLLDQEIEVKPSTVTVGTVVSLYGKSLNKLGVRDHLFSYCAGFPVDVYYTGTYGYEGRETAQGELIPSPHRLNQAFEPFEYGFLSYDLQQMRDGNNLGYPGVLAYLQGFPILNRRRYVYEGRCVLVHLNNTFKARMPDRDCLINESEQKDAIDLAVKTILKRRLLTLKAENPTAVLSYRDLARELDCLDIFNDIDVLPVHLFYTLESVKKDSQEGMDVSYLNPDSAGREFFDRDYLSKQLIVASIADGNNEEDDFNMALNTALMRSRTLIMSEALDPKHWIYDILSHLPVIDDESEQDSSVPAIQPVSVEYTSLKSTVWQGITVHLVDQYTINVPSLGLSVVVGGDDGLAIGADEDGYSRNGTAQDIFLLPPRADSQVLTQVRDWYYTDEAGNERYHEDEAEEDLQSLQGIIDLLRGTNESDVLKVVLARTDFSVRRALQGKAFQVKFFENGELEVCAA